MNFNELNIKPFIKDTLNSISFKKMTSVQEEVIPLALKGESLIVQSQTGSGKTHAFLIPILNQIVPDDQKVQAVITAPSRELANQIYEFAMELVGDQSEEIRVSRFVGGTDKERQIEKLGNQQPHLVIGTPGRIFDLMQENALWVQSAKTLVVDEADMTFDLGFLAIVDEIASRMAERLQMMVFSATIPQQVSVFLNKYMTGPKEITIEPKQVLTDQVENYLIDTKGVKREELVYNLLTIGQPYLAIIFCNTRSYADEISGFLKGKGLKVATIHGGIPPRERNRIMKQIRNLEFQYVVASDLAARGIDIPGISHVINTELPKDLEFFIHRVGRTARNELTGTAYTFMGPNDEAAIASLEAKGIEFTEVKYSHGELKEVDHRIRRTARKNTQDQTPDPKVKQLLNRAKKAKVKPGYKHKLKQEIKEHKRSTNRRQSKLKARQERKK
ncbi:DEAD/DEAH box helicase [Facklamia miroungae]|uniref:ATP-dependent RNA helicase CshB n=1 Tax=Facklamia miroungae TaxID=120956 RepID=A0A1G7R3B8_9LACT|nr:DEAD/DEAH box helicase [Facklamia miroungae]NKZ29169.1 DEAD/DEAH box helicase [Facklamia miroungae]SDG05262.1 ATP-dependent RNA helicase CshB [Facklamia miroungae]